MTKLSRKHLVLICFPAFGHYIPMSELARKISAYHDVTLVISSSKIDDIKQRGLVPGKGIRLFPLDDGLSINLDNHLDAKLLVDTMLSLAPYYIKFIEGLTIAEGNDDAITESDIPPVSAAIVDTAMHSPFEPCNKRNFPAYGFCCLSASLSANFIKMDENTPTVPDEDFLNGGHNGFTAIPESFKGIAIDGMKAMKSMKEIIANSFEALEPTSKSLFAESPATVNTPFKFIGPLIPDASSEPQDDILSKNVRVWLDAQAEKSVVYFSFGSMATATAEQLLEIGEALLSLKKPFIWSLRPFQQAHLPEKFIRWTAENFSIEVPYLIIPWAPQKAILAHKSTRVFVSHCGWNSSLEAVSYGIPVVCWPMFGDQHANAMLLPAIGVGIAIPGTGLRGVRTVSSEEISEAIKTVAGWTETEDAEKYVKKAKEYREKAEAAIAENGDSTKNFMALMHSF